MGQIIVTMKVLPDSPERDLTELGKKVEEVLLKFGKLYKRSLQPIAFGINALIYAFVLEEEQTKGGTDPIEEEIKKVEGVQDAQVTDTTKMVDVDFK